jgi:hypothetical protein
MTRKRNRWYRVVLQMFSVTQSVKEVPTFQETPWSPQRIKESIITTHMIPFQTSHPLLTIHCRLKLNEMTI